MSKAFETTGAMLYSDRVAAVVTEINANLAATTVVERGLHFDLTMYAEYFNTTKHNDNPFAGKMFVSD